jgi:ABC-2 type transport system permease protein
MARTIAGVLALAVLVGAACWAILALRDGEPEVAAAVTVLAGSAVTLGFALAPLITGAVDPLDPRRFGVLGIPVRPLAATLVLAGVISIPILAVAALYVCLAILWESHGVPWPLGAVGALLGILTCVLLARVSMALSAMFLSDRRSRELTGLFALALLVVAVPVAVFLASLQWRGRVPSQLSEAAGLLAITPFGAPAAFPARLATGGEAWQALLVVVLSVLLLGALWGWLVSRMLSTPERPAAVRERGGLGWFAVAPGTPGGAVAARSLLYWLHDRRYLVNVIVVPITAVLTMVPPLLAGVGFGYVVLLPVPLMALMFGWMAHNDLAYDSSAVWLHFASGLRGFSDRIGRLVPILVISVPILAVTIPIAISLHGRWALLPAMVGACASLFLCGLGLSSIASVVAPYAVSRPGESPFRQPQRTGAGGAISQSLVLGGALALSAPTLWLAWVALTDDIAFADWALWGGLATGVGVLLIGLAVGSLVFERREGALMEFAEQT